MPMEGHTVGDLPAPARDRGANRKRVLILPEGSHFLPSEMNLARYRKDHSLCRTVQLLKGLGEKDVRQVIEKTLIKLKDVRQVYNLILKY